MNALQSNTLLQGGRYKIVKFLGQGGFGITYLAIQDGLERKVAIKEFFIKELCNRDESTSHVTIGTEGSRDTINRFREKFLKEARNIAKLNHPNIIRIIDVFEENHTAYYVMEYAENGSLADKVNKQGYLTEPVATHYILQVANALGYIHQQKMNHLDVKPANIMLNEKDEPILVDFGLSKQYDTTTGNQTSTTPVGISEGYAPMEQYKQGGVGTFSPETDIYSLGATFFKLLTGTTPPSASDIYEDGIPVEELKAKGISQKAIRVICSAMEARKKDRMHDVKAFIERLQDTTTPLKTDKTTNRPTRTNVEKTEETALVAETQKSEKKQPHIGVEKPNKPLNTANNSSTGHAIWPIIGLIGIIIVAVIIGMQYNRTSSNEFVCDSDSITDIYNILYEEGLSWQSPLGSCHYTGPVDTLDIPHGYGEAKFADGRYYKGNLDHGQFTGDNCYFKYPNGDEFKGKFRNNSFYYGTYKIAEDGSYFTGSYKNGQPNDGTWYNKNGIVIQ